MNWEEVDFKLLQELRSDFLSERPTRRNYWSSRNVLEHYDLTFGARIRWKWDSVCEELSTRWALPENLPWILDWGCGTGGALRAFLSNVNVPSGVQCYLSDRSPLAVEVASQKFREDCPGRDVKVIGSGDIPEGSGLVLLSHVQTELLDRDALKIRKFLSAQEAFIWVEPGTPDCSRTLVDLREAFRYQFHCVAPCPHESKCGLVSQKEWRDWCHHFAKVPNEVFQHRGWRKWSEALRIDLRSLPVSYLAMSRSPNGILRPEEKRVLGRPRHYKGMSKWLMCSEGGVAEEIRRE